MQVVFAILDYIEIRKIKECEREKALELVWRTFLKFEALDYTEEEILKFKKSIDDEQWIKIENFLELLRKKKY